MKHLYNTYRPNNLDEIKGQEETVAIMKGIIDSGNLPHTLLFVGVRGTGKTSIGRIFSRYVNCEHPTPNGPCNECAACREILNESSMDVLEYDGASNNKVEDIHKLMESAKYEPVRKKKVFIIDECHALTTAAWQSILKILEEPPANTIFILCTTEVHKIPATIISRCRTFYFKQISVEVIKEQLSEICTKESISFDDEGLALIAKAAKGSMRDAISILEQFTVSGASCERVRSVLGLTSEECIFGLLDSIIQGRADMGLSILRDTLSAGKDAKLLVKDLITALTDVAYFIQSGDYDEIHNTDSYKEAVKELSYKVSITSCIDMIKSFSAMYAVASKSGEMDFLLQTNMLELILEHSELSLLKERVNELENTVRNIGAAPVLATPVVTTPAQANPGMVMDEAVATSQPQTPTNATTPLFAENDSSDTKSVSDDFGDFSPADDGIPFGDDMPSALSLGLSGGLLGKAKVCGTVDLFGGSANEEAPTQPMVTPAATPPVTNVPDTSTEVPTQEPTAPPVAPEPEPEPAVPSEEETDFFGDTDVFSQGASCFF